MKRLMNFLRGYRTLTIQSVYPQRLLNLCAQEGVIFWGLHWLDAHTITFTIRRSGLSRLRPLAERLGCDLTLGDGIGLPFFIGRFRTRYAFLLGLSLAVTAVLVLSNFVLSIQVVGNQTVPTGTILSQLSALGVNVGVYAPNIPRVDIAQQALLELEELSFMAINRYGTRLEVVVRERTMPPKLPPTDQLYSIFSTADGIIESVNVHSGQRRVVVGDIVAKGDLLISGEVELVPPEYSTEPSRWMEMSALGEVTARTWRTLEGQIPLSATTKVYTEEKTNAYFLTLLGNSVKFFGNSSILEGKCDKITTVYPLTLPGDIVLPLSLTVEECRGYRPQAVTVHQEAAQQLIEQQLLSRLESELGEGGIVLDVSYTSHIVGDSLYVTLNAQCREEIGVSRPVTPTHTNEVQGDSPEE